jgi:hypothetical protein
MSRITEPPENTVETPILLHALPPSDHVNPAWNRLFPPITDAVTGTLYGFWSMDDGTRTGKRATGYFPPPVQAVPTPTPTANTEPPKKKHKRKFEAINPNDLPNNAFPVLVPSVRNTISRHSPPTSASSESSSNGIKANMGYGSCWSREPYLENDRSNNPSDREIAIEKKREEARTKARVEAAAAKRSKKSGKRRGSATASASRAGSPEDTPGLNIVLAFAAPNGMKRTRSAGLPAISTSLANALGTANVVASSPLKAVTGPNTPEREPVMTTSSAESGPVRRGRSRLSGGSDESPPNEPGSGRKANSHSPTTSTIPLAAEPPNGNTVHNPLHGKALAGATSMRRVVSASNIGKKNGNSTEAARERSKREVILPGRLRDYDVKATTPACKFTKGQQEDVADRKKRFPLTSLFPAFIRIRRFRSSSCPPSAHPPPGSYLRFHFRSCPCRVLRGSQYPTPYHTLGLSLR